MTLRDDFAIFILSNGRPGFLAEHTINALDQNGYTGPWYVVLDDEDKTRDQYEEMFGAERILLFHKDDQHTDMGDNGGLKATIVYARNAVDSLAAERGIGWTLQLDDDYNWFGHRFIEGEHLRGCLTTNLDEVIEVYLDFLADTGAVTVAFAQGGDFMGGAKGPWLASTPVRRKAMNSFFSKVGRPPVWVGRWNEDVNTYVSRGATGDLYLTATNFMLDQMATQQTPGGIGDAYKQIGTYTKSFYSVMFAPSTVKVSVLGRIYDRVHHIVLWNSAVPKIISDRYRKPRADA